MPIDLVMSAQVRLEDAGWTRQWHSTAGAALATLPQFPLASVTKSFTDQRPPAPVWKAACSSRLSKFLWVDRRMDWDAASAFASCGHVVAYALISLGPIPDCVPAER